MVTITTDAGSFTADTMREAQKIARKAQREFDKRQAERMIDEMHAAERAKARGFLILSRVLSRQDFPSSWIVDTVPVRGLESTGGTIRQECELSGKITLHVTDYDEKSRRYVSATTTIYAYEVTGFVQDNSGRPLVLWARHYRDESTLQAYAVAAIGESVALIALPACITPELFNAPASV